MGLDLHEMVGKKYDEEKTMEVIAETERNPVKVDFRLVCELLNEGDKCMTIAELIGILEMNEIPMSDPVRKLGICAGVLYA